MLNEEQKERLKKEAISWVFVQHETAEIIEQPLTTIVKVKTGDYEGGIFACMNEKHSDGPREYLLFIEIMGVTKPERKFRFYTR